MQNPLNDLNLNEVIHQAALAPHLSLNDLNEICDISMRLNFSRVCTNPIRVSSARERLGSKSKTKLIAVIGFPFGSNQTQIKRLEADLAASEGAEELDLAPNFFALAKGQTDIFADEIATICEIGLPVRVILDIAHLPPDRVYQAIEASIDAGATAIQSGNGFGSSVKYNEIMKISRLCKGRCAIKAAGGIKKLSEVIPLLQSGATAIGTSFGPQLIEEFREHSKSITNNK